MDINFSLAKYSHLATGTEIPEHSPVVWQAWLADLPLLNTGKSASLIQQALQEIKLKAPFDPENWFAILEQFKPILSSIQTSVTETFLTADALSLSKKLTISGLLQTSNWATVEAYNQLLTNLMSVPEQLNKKLLTKVIIQLMNYLAEILLQSFQVYTDAPKGLWLKLHALYKIAIDLQLTDHLTTPKEKITIQSVYLRACLLAIADLYGLNSGDMRKIYNTLSAWAIKAQLLNNLEGNYLICLDHDKPPIYQKMQPEKLPEETWLSLNVSTLLALIENLLNHPEQNRVNLVPETLLLHLKESWGNLKTRSFPRIKHNSQIRVCIGLAAAHYFINEVMGTTDNPLIDSPATAKTKLENADDLPPLAIDDQASANKTAETNLAAKKNDLWKPDFLLENKADAAVKADTSLIKPSYNNYYWQNIDISPQGLGLFSTAESAEIIKIGEIIGIQEQDKALSGIWYIGAVRWLKQTANAELITGVELLSTSAMAVWIQMPTEPKPLRALFLPVSETNKNPAIITLDRNYPLNSLITLQQGDNTYQIVFTKQITKEGRFKWFEFQRQD